MRNLCNLRGKHRPCNIENYVVATHLYQQMRNSFLPVPWEELPEQVLQLCRLVCHRHSSNSADNLSHEKIGELHRKSRKRPGAWKLNGCSRSGLLQQVVERKGEQGSSVILLIEQ